MTDRKVNRLFETRWDIKGLLCFSSVLFSFLASTSLDQLSQVKRSTHRISKAQPLNQHLQNNNAHLLEQEPTNTHTHTSSLSSSTSNPTQWPGTPQTTAPSAAGTSPSTNGTTTRTTVDARPSPPPAAPATGVHIHTRAAVSARGSTSTRRPSGARAAEAVTGLLPTTITCPGDIIDLLRSRW